MRDSILIYYNLYYYLLLSIIRNLKNLIHERRKIILSLSHLKYEHNLYAMRKCVLYTCMYIYRIYLIQTVSEYLKTIYFFINNI